jgi:2-polyprenyl-3-methyl-5-hydroxy-6-metoxy-1,4-benzoquinol methylase
MKDEFLVPVCTVQLDDNGDSEMDVTPNLETVGSQLCTASQFREFTYYRLAAEIRQLPVFHRKQWEYIYILRALEQFGMLQQGRRGLGFGCGKEPLAAVMAGRGVKVTCTDIAPVEQGDGYWGSTSVEDFFYGGICSREMFLERVDFRPADMNQIPDDLRDYDFVWSSCALEHLGSLKQGSGFVLNAMNCLVPGGIAVHTTEYNLDDDSETFESRDLSLYRRREIKELQLALESEGYVVIPFNSNAGSEPLDKYVDLPPYSRDKHLKLMIETKFVVTSAGIIVCKRG